MRILSIHKKYHIILGGTLKLFTQDKYTKIALILGVFVFWTIGIEANANKIVFVSIAPQKYFVNQIAGNLIDVTVMVEPGASPATYEPRPKQMAALTKAQMYFSIGIPFEDIWLRKFSQTNKNMLIVDTSSGIEKIPMLLHYHNNEEHVEGQERINEFENNRHIGKPDPHIWLSPPLATLQVNTIFNSLVKLDPANAQKYKENHNIFIAKINNLHEEIKKILAGKKGQRFLVSHPAWGYFAKTYGLIQIPIEIEGKNPKPSQLTELILYAKRMDINSIFVQPQFSAKAARVLSKEINGNVFIANSLAINWPENLLQVAESIKNTLR